MPAQIVSSRHPPSCRECLCPSFTQARQNSFIGSSQFYSTPDANCNTRTADIDLHASPARLRMRLGQPSLAVSPMKNLAKRKRVMARSMRLGHCICNAKKSCPCDVFQQQDICPCAGESANGDAGPVRLMSMVQSAGCASKIDKATLGRVLAGLPFFDDPRVLVGAPAGDDAGVYRLDDEVALVQTVDVFSPSADDPYTFGQIAAANSLSDVYAMGGRPPPQRRPGHGRSARQKS